MGVSNYKYKWIQVYGRRKYRERKEIFSKQKSMRVYLLERRKKDE